MSNLLSSLISSAGAFQAYDRAINVIQNNVANSSTPGYAKLRQSLSPLMLDTERGFPGGVLADEVVSYRDLYAEKAVRAENESAGFWSRRAESLATLESSFPVSGDTGVSAALSDLYEAFSDLAVYPNSSVTRQSVLKTAGSLAAEFNQTAANLGAATTSTWQQVHDTVSKVNDLAAQIRDINQQIRNNYASATSSGIDTQLNTALENLSALADITTVEQGDGTVTVLLGGQVPLVIGATQYEVSANTSDGKAVVLDSQGNDVTDGIESGKLGASLKIANETIPSYQSDLNRLAEAFADRINTILAEGVDSYGNTPTRNLFTYSTDRPAASLAVNDLEPEELAAASADSPGGNGNALTLAALVNSDEIDGLTFTEFYGQIAARVGSDSSQAQENESVHTDLLAQAETQREEAQGVSLDEEAANLILFQRAYEATAKMVQVLDEMTQTVIEMI